MPQEDESDERRPTRLGRLDAIDRAQEESQANSLDEVGGQARFAVWPLVGISRFDPRRFSLSDRNRVCQLVGWNDATAEIGQ